MKKVLLAFLFVILVLSCAKKEIPYETRYPRPWKTEHISYKNLINPCGAHSQGYDLFYMDTIVRSECQYMGGMALQSPLVVNDSLMMFFKPTNMRGEVLRTGTGGYTWSAIYVGTISLSKFHFVNAKLTYCITHSLTDLYFTGIGKSALSVHKTTVTKGRHYISDLGTAITEMDSTVITINDSLSFVVLFK